MSKCCSCSQQRLPQTGLPFIPDNISWYRLILIVNIALIPNQLSTSEICQGHNINSINFLTNSLLF